LDILPHKRKTVIQDQLIAIASPEIAPVVTQQINIDVAADVGAMPANFALELTRGPFLGPPKSTAWRHAGRISLPPRLRRSRRPARRGKAGAGGPRAAQQGALGGWLRAVRSKVHATTSIFTEARTGEPRRSNSGKPPNALAPEHRCCRWRVAGTVA